MTKRVQVITGRERRREEMGETGQWGEKERKGDYLRWRNDVRVVTSVIK